MQALIFYLIGKTRIIPAFASLQIKVCNHYKAYTVYIFVKRTH